MKQKHKWESLGFFTYRCSICGELDWVSKDNRVVVSMAEEQERIQNRTDCFEMYIKHKVVPRLLGVRNVQKEPC